MFLCRPLLMAALLPALLLGGCGGRRADWPTLAPRPGEVSTMVARNVAGPARCAVAAECAPPAAEPAAAESVPAAVPQPGLADARAELAAIAAVVEQVAAAAGPARQRLGELQAAAAGRPADSAAASRAEAAQSALDAALAPLAGAAFRLQALDLATRSAPDRRQYEAEMMALTDRITQLGAQ